MTERTVHPDPDQFALDPARSGQTPPAAEADDVAPARPANAQTDELAAMRQEIADLRRAALEAASRPVVPAAAVTRAQPRTPEVAVDLSGLPDPATDIAAFNKGLSERIGRAVNAGVAGATEAAVALSRAEAERQARFEQVWARFKDKHEDLAPHDEIVAGAATRVVSALRGRGVDAEAYMAQNQDDFIAQVAKEASKTINKIKGLNEDGSDPVDNEDEGRAAGLPADRVGGTSRGARATKAEKPALFTDELKAVQRELRIF